MSKRRVAHHVEDTLPVARPIVIEAGDDLEFVACLCRLARELRSHFPRGGEAWERDDIVQQALAGLVRLRAQDTDRQQSRAGLAAYAKRAVRSRLCDSRRIHQRRRIVDDDYAHCLDPHALAADELLAQIEDVTLCRRLVASLPVRLREVIVARELEGLSIQQTASALRIPSSAVKSRRRSALRMLRQLAARALLPQAASNGSEGR